VNEELRVTPPVPGGEPPRDNLLERFWGLIVAPGRTSAAIALRPSWVLASLLLFLVSTVFSALTLHILGPEQLELQLESAVSDEQIQAITEQIEEMRDPGLAMRLVLGVMSGIGAWLFVALLPGLIYHPFLRLSEGTGQLAQTLGVACWASLVAYTLKYALTLVLVLGKGTVMGVGTGLVLLAPDARYGSTLFLALSIFGDVFVWWQTVLFAIGFAVVHRLPLRRAATVTVALAVLAGLIMLGFQSIASRLGG
jgi:hypothetical protein